MDWRRIEIVEIDRDLVRDVCTSNSPTWRQSCVCVGRLSCDLQLSRRAPPESISLLGKHDRVDGWAIVDSRSPYVTIKVCRPFILRALPWICRTWNRLCYINLRSAPYADVYAKWQRVVNALDSSNLNLSLLRDRRTGWIKMLQKCTRVLVYFHLLVNLLYYLSIFLCTIQCK